MASVVSETERPLIRRKPSGDQYRFALGRSDGRTSKGGFSARPARLLSPLDGRRRREELPDRLDADREAVERTDIRALEAEIDRAVYDLFESTDGERGAAEEYLDVVRQGWVTVPAAGRSRRGFLP